MESSLSTLALSPRVLRTSASVNDLFVSNKISEQPGEGSVCSSSSSSGSRATWMPRICNLSAMLGQDFKIMATDILKYCGPVCSAKVLRFRPADVQMASSP